MKCLLIPIDSEFMILTGIIKLLVPEPVTGIAQELKKRAPQVETNHMRTVHPIM
jgi:hypothetical protein